MALSDRVTQKTTQLCQVKKSNDCAPSSSPTSAAFVDTPELSPEFLSAISYEKPFICILAYITKSEELELELSRELVPACSSHDRRARLVHGQQCDALARRVIPHVGIGHPAADHHYTRAWAGGRCPAALALLAAVGRTPRHASGGAAGCDDGADGEPSIIGREDAAGGSAAGHSRG